MLGVNRVATVTAIGCQLHSTDERNRMSVSPGFA